LAKVVDTAAIEEAKPSATACTRKFLGPSTQWPVGRLNW
jgi:hypothetical protein